MGLLKRRMAKVRLMFSKAIKSRNYMRAYNRFLKVYGVDVSGDVKYIHPSVYIDVGYARNIHIGDNCVISVNSVLLAHDYSVECGMTAIGRGDRNNEKKLVKDVYIGKNVFIGAGCIILPGTHIGDNCIIGAGTVCSGMIPDNSVVVGEKYRILRNTMEWAKEKLESTVKKEFEGNPDE